MKAKITDVARRAGVSIATVSHVVNGTRYVTETTRKRVEAAIRELDYSPNAAARSFKTGRQNMVGFITSNLSDRFCTLLLEEVDNEIGRSGYNVVVFNTHENHQREIAGIKLLTSGITDGLILASTFHEYRDLSPYIPPDFPLVMIDRVPKGYAGDSVRAACAAAVKQAVVELSCGGARQVGFITDFLRLSSIEDRLDGYKSGLAEVGLPFDPELVKTDTPNNGGLCAERLYKQGVRAFFFASSAMVQSALEHLDAMGLTPGREVAIATMRDYPFSALMRWPISMVAQPTVEIAALAAQMLVRRIERPASAVQEALLSAVYEPHGDRRPSEVGSEGPGLAGR